MRAGKTFCFTKGGSFSGKRGLPDFKYCIATASSLLCQTTQHCDRKIQISSKNYEVFLPSKPAKNLDKIYEKIFLSFLTDFLSF